eukprot:NODE_1902_length_1039_cov_46.777778_g1546_i0.p2 GENE.NODE_1902_length_1039_cov_46.777778_g1546_i0~~NODE_1902_length_1039_cov_46.777778_g1546_i0.p2  ORF type:complete len:320 (+),score=120.90 NODE_1902_length_1039_cov_46.777778_g1546_i0:103-960(+)
MVEEFMLLANISVAAQIHKHFPAMAFLRRHPPPFESQFEMLQEALAQRGMQRLAISSSKALAESLDAAKDPSDPFMNTLVRMMTIRCMQQAKYFVSGELPYPEFRHYGLATDIYTHFTSPIRRYADVLVHRQLAATLGLCSISIGMSDKNRQHEAADNINYRHHQAQQAGRDSNALYTGFFFKGRVEKCEGYVIFKRENGVVVFVPKFSIEGIVWHDELQGKSLKVFDKVKVEITISSDEACRNKVVIKMADNKRKGAEVDTKAVEIKKEQPQKKRRKTKPAAST